MFRTRLAATLAIAALCACSPKEETPEAEEPSVADTEPAEEAKPAFALLDACTVKMTQPEAHEWQTKWNPARLRPSGDHPSNVRSTHWGEENEKKSAHDMGTVNPLTLNCSTHDDVQPMFGMSIDAFDSSMTDIPLAPGTYQIVPKAGPGKTPPGKLIVSVMLFGESMFEAKSGTVTLDRFDMNGAAGSFVIDGNEILMGSRPMHVEGTFDMPCRKELLQSACTSGKAEQLD